MICNDSNYPEVARAIAAQGAAAMFIPTNNSLPLEKADAVAQARKVDIATARDNTKSIIRADVAGSAAGRVSYGSSCIVDSNGTVLLAGRPLTEDLLVAEIDTGTPARPLGHPDGSWAVQQTLNLARNQCRLF